jgi:hypothetical protein
MAIAMNQYDHKIFGLVLRYKRVVWITTLVGIVLAKLFGAQYLRAMGFLAPLAAALGVGFIFLLTYYSVRSLGVASNKKELPSQLAHVGKTFFLWVLLPSLIITLVLVLIMKYVTHVL